MPVGITTRSGASGLPIGVQVMGRAMDEHTVLRVAGLIEKSAGIGDVHPAFATEAPPA